MPVATMNLSTDKGVKTSLSPVPPHHPQPPPAEREFFRDPSNSHVQLPGPCWDSKLPPEVSLRTGHFQARLCLSPAA